MRRNVGDGRKRNNSVVGEIRRRSDEGNMKNSRQRAGGEVYGHKGYGIVGGKGGGDVGKTETRGDCRRDVVKKFPERGRG